MTCDPANDPSLPLSEDEPNEELLAFGSNGSVSNLPIDDFLASLKSVEFSESQTVSASRSPIPDPCQSFRKHSVDSSSLCAFMAPLFPPACSSHLPSSPSSNNDVKNSPARTAKLQDDDLEDKWMAEFKDALATTAKLAESSLPPQPQPSSLAAFAARRFRGRRKDVPRLKPVATINTKKRPSKASKKPRRVFPATKEFIPEATPTDMDVVGGRGGVSTHHVGNRRYWNHVLNFRSQYKSCGDNNVEKGRIARTIVDAIESGGGRFLQKDGQTKRFFVLPQKVVLDKVKQALRDEYVPLWAR